jgi:hypothetical protein
MKLNPRIFVVVLVIAAGVTFTSGRVAAQAVPLSTDLPVKPKAVKPLKYDGQVIASNSATITVRSKGGYQFGDKVVIHYTPGTVTAVKLQGKPSKPRMFTSPNTSQK